jgi:hypothetical protein
VCHMTLVMLAPAMCTPVRRRIHVCHMREDTCVSYDPSDASTSDVYTCEEEDTCVSYEGGYMCVI